MGAQVSDALRVALDGPMERTTMTNGILKWFYPLKGSRFIRPKERGKDVFVYAGPHVRIASVRLKQDELKRAADAAADSATRSVDASRLKSS
jgi:hypothetical protein